MLAYIQILLNIFIMYKKFDTEFILMWWDSMWKNGIDYNSCSLSVGKNWTHHRARVRELKQWHSEKACSWFPLDIFGECLDNCLNLDGIWKWDLCKYV